ncbi:MAG: ABC transporter transmembrane domain-containing protein [Pseudomonadota bacterium]
MQYAEAIGLEKPQSLFKAHWAKRNQGFILEKSIVTSTLAANLLSLALPLLLLQVYDRVIGQGGHATLDVLVIGVLVAILLDAVLRLIRARMVSWSGARFEHETTCGAYRRILDGDPAAVSGTSPAEHLQHFAAIGRLREFIGGQAFASLVELPFVVVFLGLIAVLGGPLVFAPIVLLALFAVSAWLIGRHLKKALMEREDVGDERIAFIIETLSGVHTIKALGAEASFRRRHEHLQAQLSERNYAVAMASGGAAAIGATFGQITMVAVTLTGAPMVLDQSLSLGALVACALLAGRAMQPLQRALTIWTRLQDVQIAHEQAQQIFRVPMIDKLAEESHPEREGRLSLKNVSIDSPTEVIHLDGIELELSRGQSVSVRGQGASALLQIVAGVRRQDEGEVLVDGEAPLRLRSNALAAHVGYIAPDATIFEGTIRENLSGFGAVDDRAVDEIARLLHIDEVVLKMPLGYDTPLVSGTGAIPPGLQQLIAIGRVLVRKPRLLLFDRADKGLDKDGYNAVFRLLGRLKGRVTMVIASEDRNLLRLAERAYDIVDGRLTTHTQRDDSSAYEVLPYKELRL